MIDRLSVQPLKDYISTIGGWPVLEETWDASKFNLEDWYIRAVLEIYDTFLPIVTISVDTDPIHPDRYITEVRQRDDQ